MKNPWKVATVLLFIFVCIQVSILSEDYNNQMQVENIRIDSEQFQSIFEPLPIGNFALCSLKEKDSDNPCVLLSKNSLG